MHILIIESCVNMAKRVRICWLDLTWKYPTWTWIFLLEAKTGWPDLTCFNPFFVGQPNPIQPNPWFEPFFKTFFGKKNKIGLIVCCEF